MQMWGRLRENSQREERERGLVVGAQTAESDLGSNCACLVCLLVQFTKYFVFLYEIGNDYIRVCCEDKIRNGFRICSF